MADEQLARALDRAALSMNSLASQESYSQQAMLDLRIAIQETNDLLREAIEEWKKEHTHDTS